LCATLSAVAVLSDTSKEGILMKRLLILASAFSLLLPAAAMAAPPKPGDKPSPGAPAKPGKPGGGHHRPGKPGGGGGAVKPPPGKPNKPPKPSPGPGPGKPGRPPGRPHHPGYRPPPPGWSYHRPTGSQFYWRGKWYGRYRAPAYAYPTGYSYRRWYPGDHIPALFLAAQFFFDNYAQIGLEVPPPGYRWVRYGPDALLVNQRTGAVEDVVYGAFY
jgi:Ni/Co efflux regulator RcnB